MSPSRPGDHPAGPELVEIALTFLRRREAAGLGGRPPLRLSRAQRAQAVLRFLEALDVSPWLVGDRIRQLADGIEATQTDPGQVDELAADRDRQAAIARTRALRDAFDQLAAAGEDLWADVRTDVDADRGAAA